MQYNRDRYLGKNTVYNILAHFNQLKLLAGHGYRFIPDNQRELYMKRLSAYTEMPREFEYWCHQEQEKK